MGYSMKTRNMNPILALFAVLAAFVVVRFKHLRDDVNGFIDMNRPLVIVGAIFAVVIAILVIGLFIGPLFDATTSISENFSQAETGDATVDPMLPVFGTLIVLAIVLGLVAAVIGWVRFRR